MKLPGFTAALLLALGIGATARGDESTISVNAAGGASFAVRATLTERVSAMDISVDYDAGTLTQPVAKCGQLAAQAKCEISTSTSGLVTIHVSSDTPMEGGGILARISFSPVEDQPGVINSLDARLTGPNGDNLPVQLLIVAPSGTQQGQKVAAGAVARQDPKPVEGAGSVEGQGTDSVTVAEVGKNYRQISSGSGYRRVPGVLDRFREKESGATLGSLAALFEPTRVQEMCQEPPIALSDGSRTLLLMVQLPVESVVSPHFILSGVHFVSLRSEHGNRWLIEVLPKKGVHEASLLVLAGAAVTEYPLTVAPALTPARKNPGMTDFSAWQQSRSRPGIVPDDPLGDLPDYVKDYIYVANFLVLQGTGR